MITYRNNSKLSKRLNLSLILCLVTVENVTVCLDSEDEEVVQPGEFLIRMNYKSVRPQLFDMTTSCFPLATVKSKRIWFPDSEDDDKEEVTMSKITTIRKHTMLILCLKRNAKKSTHKQEAF